MTGNGADSGADDQTYTWACCSEMTAFVDSLGTAALVYNDRSQLTSNTDSNGNAVLYEYDTVGRVSKVTPPQGHARMLFCWGKPSSSMPRIPAVSSFAVSCPANRWTLAGSGNTNGNGSVSQVKVYDAGSAGDTDYTYDTTSGGSRGAVLPGSVGVGAQLQPTTTRWSHRPTCVGGTAVPAVDQPTELPVAVPYKEKLYSSNEKLCFVLAGRPSKCLHETATQIGLCFEPAGKLRKFLV